MTTHELLTPRYECIAPYPWMNGMKAGCILHYHPVSDNEYYLVNADGSITQMYRFDQPLSAFPANFRAMHWSEGRALEDMPEYVKNGKGVVVESSTIKNDKGFHFLFKLPDTLPATKEDYEAYQNSKKI